MTYYIVEIEGELYAKWPIVTETSIGDGIIALPKGEPFQGVPYERIKPGDKIEAKDQAAA